MMTIKSYQSVFDFLTAAQIDDVRSGSMAIDTATSIQAAINATTGTLSFPTGTYRLDSPISWTKSYLTLQGEGEGATRLTGTFAAGDIITCGDGVAIPSNCSVRNLSITSSIARTAGAAIRFRNGHSLAIENVQLEINHFWGFQFDGGPEQFNYTLRNFEINSGQYGIIVGGDGLLVQDIFVDTGVIASCTGAGIILIHANGFYFKYMDIIACGNGVNLSPGNNQVTNSGWFDTVLCDTASNNGWNLVPSDAAEIADITFTSCWSATSGTASNGYGFLIQSGLGKIDGLTFISPRIINNKAIGIYVTGGTNIYITSPQIYGNSQASVGGFPGVRFAPGVSKWSIIGGAIGLGGGVPTNPQSYGILVDGGTSENFEIIGVNVTGNVTGGILNGASGVHTILGCPGYITRNSGTVQISKNTTSTTVTHGLNAAPTAMSITPIGDPQQRWWLSDVSPTQLTINIAEDAASPVFFQWSVWIS